MTTIVLGAYGAIAPSYINSPELGYPAGSLLGAAINPDRKTVKQPSTAEMRNQSSQFGNPIPIVYPSYRVAGQIIWTDEQVEHTTGTGTTAKTTFTSSFAVGICEGPIIGLRRVWADNKIIYDAAKMAAGGTAAGLAFKASGYRLYLGTEDQLPDPLIESVLGVGNVPAHRGMAYLIIEDLDLTLFGNRLPVLNFEVVAATEITVADVVLNISKRCGLQPWDVDVSALGAILHGYGIQHTSGRSAIEPLMRAYRFDAVESEDKIRFVLRGATPSLAITTDELLEREG